MIKKLLKFFLLDDKPTISSSISNSTQNTNAPHFSNNANSKIATNGSTIIDNSLNANFDLYSDINRLQQEEIRKAQEFEKYENVKNIVHYVSLLLSAIFFILLYFFPVSKYFYLGLNYLLVIFFIKNYTYYKKHLNDTSLKLNLFYFFLLLLSIALSIFTFCNSLHFINFSINPNFISKLIASPNPISESIASIKLYLIWIVLMLYIVTLLALVFYSFKYRKNKYNFVRFYMKKQISDMLVLFSLLILIFFLPEIINFLREIINQILRLQQAK